MSCCGSKADALRRGAKAAAPDFVDAKLRLMKFDQLRAIGHNIADSLAGGMGLLIGVYRTDIFDEAGPAPRAS